MFIGIYILKIYHTALPFGSISSLDYTDANGSMTHRITIKTLKIPYDSISQIYYNIARVTNVLQTK
jgi:hypothetical protein